MITFGLGRHNQAFGLGAVYPYPPTISVVSRSGRLYWRKQREIWGSISGEFPGLMGKAYGTADPYSEQELALLMTEDLL